MKVLRSLLLLGAVISSCSAGVVRPSGLAPAAIPVQPYEVPIQPFEVPIQPRKEMFEVPAEQIEEFQPFEVPIQPRQELFEVSAEKIVEFQPFEVLEEPRSVPIQPRQELFEVSAEQIVEVQPFEVLEEPRSVPIQPRANECQVTIRGGITNPQPIFLKTNAAEFYPYSDLGVMQVTAGQTLEMWCPGAFTFSTAKLLTATCVGGTTFKVGGTSYDWKEFACKSWPGSVAKKTGVSCNGGTMVNVGFEISSSRFVKQMEICFNEDEEVTRYVHHTLQPGNNYYQTGIDRVTFQTAGFFGGKNVDKLYTQATQQETITSDLGYDSSKYFDTSKNVFLARGHMGAKADFVYGSEQRATFLFINAAPQWQTFNAGNWARVEDGVRAYVSKNKWNVDCYTGVYGVSKLPNKSNVDTPLYLSKDSNNNGLIPVPALYFRVVIQPSTKKGIVFIGVNNPHLTLDQIKKDYIICPDISDKVTYISWKKTDITAGYSYACEVSAFTKVVKNLPALSASGGLLL